MAAGLRPGGRSQNETSSRIQPPATSDQQPASQDQRQNEPRSSTSTTATSTSASTLTPALLAFDYTPSAILLPLLDPLQLAHSHPHPQYGCQRPSRLPRRELEIRAVQVGFARYVYFFFLDALELRLQLLTSLQVNPPSERCAALTPQSHSVLTFIQSSIVLRFVKVNFLLLTSSFSLLTHLQDQFDSYRESTIGAAFLTQTISLDDNTTVKFEIWDTAGQERYKSLAPMYYRNANCAVVVYDITQSVSFLFSSR